MKQLISQLAVLTLFSGQAFAADSSNVVATEVCVYGGTPAGVMAAVAAARQGHTVALLDVNGHVGGMISGGLVNTDIGVRATVGGLSDEFLQRAVQYYVDKYGPDSPQPAACKNARKFEPHVAELVFEQMLKEQPKITLWRRHRYRSVTLDAGRIKAVVVEDLVHKTARTFTAKVFIDASYEGDVMAGAGVPYRVGREGREEYDESLAGINVGPDRGQADHRVMAYNYRVSITPRTENRVLFPKPEHYDPEPWRAKYGPRIASGKLKSFSEFFISKPGANGKHDANWCDLVGGSEDYPEGDWETRDAIAARHRDYFLSLLYYLQNDPELPESFRNDARNWGLPKDEFIDNGHFPFQLYVREARRMVGRYVLRQRDLTDDRAKPDGVCAGNYGVDCHAVRKVEIDGKWVIDRTSHISVEPYDIPYACLTPNQPGNLLVPVCCSATHVAYCSLRMEPVYMMLGHAAGNAAHLAIANNSTVQEVDVERLRGLLREQGAVLHAGSTDAKALTAEAKAKAKSKPLATHRPSTNAGQARLPRVLLIGDSVSAGYAPRVSKLLAGKAEVRRIPGNGGSTGHGLAMLDEWLGDEPWDMIHFNFGLHDVRLPPEGNRHTSLEQYERNLREMVKRLKSGGAKLIWAATTPVPDGGVLAPDRRFGDVREYNAIAAKVMQENEIVSDDLYEAMRPRLAEFQKPDDVYFTKAGSEFLAKQVAAMIAGLLPKR